MILIIHKKRSSFRHYLIVWICFSVFLNFYINFICLFKYKSFVLNVNVFCFLLFVNRTEAAVHPSRKSAKFSSIDSSIVK